MARLSPIPLALMVFHRPVYLGVFFIILYFGTVLVGFCPVLWLAGRFLERPQPLHELAAKQAKNFTRDTQQKF